MMKCVHLLDNEASLFEKNICKKVYYVLYGYCIIVARNISVNIVLFKGSKINIRKCCELCLELTIEILERRQLLVLIFLTLNK